MEKWLRSTDKDVAWVMQSNLAKARIAALGPGWVERWRKKALLSAPGPVTADADAPPPVMATAGAKKKALVTKGARTRAKSSTTARRRKS